MMFRLLIKDKLKRLIKLVKWIIYRFIFYVNPISRTSYLTDRTHQGSHPAGPGPHCILHPGSPSHSNRHNTQLLSTYLRPGSLLTHIFSPRPLLNILSARKLPSRPKVLQRGTNSNNLSPRQCLKLSILTLDSNPVEDLFVLAQQILETLEEWAVLTSKI